VLKAIHGIAHHDGMAGIRAWLPKEELLYEEDAFRPINVTPMQVEIHFVDVKAATVTLPLARWVKH